MSTSRTDYFHSFEWITMNLHVIKTSCFRHFSFGLAHSVQLSVLGHTALMAECGGVCYLMTFLVFLDVTV